MREWTIYLDSGPDHYAEDVSGPNTERVRVVEKSALIKALEEIELLMNVDYWPERCKAAERERDKLKPLLTRALTLLRIFNNDPWKALASDIEEAVK